jgi:cytidylate kinase
MTRCNSDRLIEALIAAQMMEYQLTQTGPHEEKRLPAPPVVTISRNFGALGREVANLLAETLGVRCCDRYILQEVARRADVDEDLVRALDEHVSKLEGNWWADLLQPSTFNHDDYYHYLVKVILSITRTGGVILGRGAHMILGKKMAFRVRITGCLELCANRVAERENLDIEQARQRIIEVDNERTEYVRRLYGTGVDEACMYDLVLNSDRFNREQMVELILIAMQKSGYALADDVLNSLRQPT